jgi:hypothetical protein
MYNSLVVEVVQPLKALVMTLSKDIKEDKFRTVFKACSKTAKDKADKVNKTKLLELLAKEVTKIGLLAVPTI